MNKDKMKKKSLLVVLSLLVCSISVWSATIDTVAVHSSAMNRNVKAVVIVPDVATDQSTYPVLYLLHGHGGDHQNWLKRVPQIATLADTHGIMIVCPDGTKDSWYWDSPMDSTSQYETFMTAELIPYIDEHYSTIKSNKGRAITGLSMGGHGALFLAFRHQNLFGACGSMSGGVDIRPFPNNWGMANKLGKQAENPERWLAHTVMGQLHLLTPNALSIIIDCGTGDFFYPMNKKLHEELLYRQIPHDFISRPGTHNWNYWANSIVYQMVFFNTFFQASNSK